ncbi:hypothetical protein AN958_06231 [Leucoagaricus sp. SymC.cos]|nr:hypothetical protein AN958_06231 [Leucoagaricus sp. SymC.cos]
MIPSALRRAQTVLHKSLPKSAPPPQRKATTKLRPHVKRVKKGFDTPTLHIDSSPKSEKPSEYFQRQKTLGKKSYTEVKAARHRARFGTFFRVRDVIKKRFGKSYDVETFGSIKYGAASPTSDMDLIVLDNERPLGFDPTNTERLPRIYHLGSVTRSYTKVFTINIYSLRQLAKALERGGFKNVQAIKASVPIVKFLDPFSGIRCDINVNDQAGYWNSLMIHQYTTLSPHLRPMLLQIKSWSRPLNLNSPSPTKGQQTSFSSYAFALMTIAFLQRRSLLPNLQADIDPDMKPHPFWNRKPVYLCDFRFNKPTAPLPKNDKTRAIALMKDWFRFWARFDPSTQMVDIKLGGILPRISQPLGQKTPAAAEEEIAGAESSLETLSDLFKPTNLVPKDDFYNVKRWENDPFCLADPFIRVKVGVDKYTL